MTPTHGPHDGPPPENSRRVRQRVFISHGSAEDAFSWRVCAAVRRALDDVGYQVFLDRDSLDPQTGWDLQIREELAACHAAVFVISRRALTREWVRREAEVLRQRQDMERIFLLVVLLDDVQPKELDEAGLQVLNSKQALKFAADPEPAGIAEAVAEEFAALLPLPGEDEPMYRWAERVSAMLRKSGDPGVLEDAAKLLGLEERDARRARCFNGSRFLARTLLSAKLGDNVPRAVFHLNAALGSDGPSLAREMEPTWVDEEAARAFIPDERSDQGRVILLNASFKRTAEHHIGRAMRRDTTQYVKADLAVLRPDEEAATESVADELWAVLRNKLAIPDRPGARRWRPPRYVYVVVPVESRARRRTLANAVRQLRKEAPWLHVVVLLEDGSPDDGGPTPWGLEDAVVVRPALDPGQEEQGHFRVQELYEAVESPCGRPERWRTT